MIKQVPVVFGSVRQFFATGGVAEPLRLESPTMIVSGDRVTHFVYDVRREGQRPDTSAVRPSSRLEGDATG